MHEIKHDGYRFVVRRDGEDLRPNPWEVRRAMLVRLLGKRLPGIRLSEHLSGDGEAIYRHACKLGAEGIVSKRRDARYKSGRCDWWIKIKNPDAPAATRVIERAAFSHQPAALRDEGEHMAKRQISLLLVGMVVVLASAAAFAAMDPVKIAARRPGTISLLFRKARKRPPRFRARMILR